MKKIAFVNLMGVIALCIVPLTSGLLRAASPPTDDPETNTCAGSSPSFRFSGVGDPLNKAAANNGASIRTSHTYTGSYSGCSAVDGDRKGLYVVSTNDTRVWGNNGAWYAGGYA